MALEKNKEAKIHLKKKRKKKKRDEAAVIFFPVPFPFSFPPFFFMRVGCLLASCVDDDVNRPLPTH